MFVFFSFFVPNLIGPSSYFGHFAIDKVCKSYLAESSDDDVKSAFDAVIKNNFHKLNVTATGRNGSKKKTHFWVQ